MFLFSPRGVSDQLASPVPVMTAWSSSQACAEYFAHFDDKARSNYRPNYFNAALETLSQSDQTSDVIAQTNLLNFIMLVFCYLANADKENQKALFDFCRATRTKPEEHKKVIVEVLVSYLKLRAELDVENKVLNVCAADLMKHLSSQPQEVILQSKPVNPVAVQPGERTDITVSVCSRQNFPIWWSRNAIGPQKTIQALSKKVAASPL